jgi:hypothetical protein
MPASERDINWGMANFRRMFSQKAKIEPAIDIPVSQIVGRKIYQQDPRLIKLIVKWRRNKPLDSTEPDNFLKDENNIKELKETLSQSL